MRSILVSRLGSWLSTLMLAMLMLPSPSHAFCGFYVASADGPLFNEATMVVLLREGNTTVLSMQNDYRGPPESFAMVIPVPVVLQEENVRTLPRDVFERVDRLASPRLVEYWEGDPCAPEPDYFEMAGLGLRGFGRGGGGAGEGTIGLGQVVVEARFEVGEYEIVILSADDSTALDSWLRDNGYRIPQGAGPVLRPYVEAGMKFFVARVNVSRVRFESGRAVLSPLRFHYDSPDFSLPVRLGLLSSGGTQDLIVHILARNQRYEVANYGNVTIPTNLDVSDDVRTRFGEFYAALFDRTIERHPRAVVTEYAWQATGCDPCPGPVLSPEDLATLGADVAVPGASPPGGPGSQRASQVRLGVATVQGALAPEVIHRVAQRHINEVRFCHEQQLAFQPGLSGRVETRFVISAAGTVQTSMIASSTLAQPRVEMCIAQATRRWSFPASDGVASVTLPFILTAVAGDPSFSTFGFGAPSPYQSFVLTRLHYRYGRDDLGEDLVFRAAPPIVGGREFPSENGSIEQGARPADANNFQGRYIIRHAWQGAIACDNPIRGRWGGPPGGSPAPTPMAAVNAGTAPRGRLSLASMLVAPLPELGVDRSGAAPPAPQAAASPGEAPAASRQPAAPTAFGCGCRAVGASKAELPWLLVVASLLAIRRRR
jgi:MYXO-CTERM domain-containing protein